ncbi:MAG TPA: universal stress protein, partial [Lapillicoccus sp.]|nr:universal stress protein [Lapillicoccus sp.]
MSVVKDLSLGAVVVALDGQNADGAAVDWAVDEAVRRGRPLHLVATGEQSSPESPLAPMVPFDAVDPTEALAQAAARVSRLVPDLDVRTTGIEGRLVPLLLGASETADTVVVTGRGTGRVRSVLLGSTAIQVASHASCPVVVVPPTHRPARAATSSSAWTARHCPPRRSGMPTCRPPSAAPGSPSSTPGRSTRSRRAS